MDLYILDDLLRRVTVIDQFESLIWTERFTALGDFEFTIQSTYANRNLFKTGTWLAIEESYRVMVVETIEDKDDSEGQSMLTISGRSLESILEDRVARHSFATLDLSPRWALTGTPGYLARAIFKYICIDGLLDDQDIIPFIQPGALLPVGNIPEPTEVLNLELELMSLYAAMRDLCDGYGLGFALLRGPDNSRLHFDVYAGSERTGRQQTLPPVIFSPELDSLSNVAHLISTEAHKNVAYVFSPTGSIIVYPLGVDPNKPGFERRILLVKVDNVRANDNENNLSTTDVLRRRGREALINYRKVEAFDGEITKTQYKYGVDYNLGDLVEMRKSDDVIKYMRVTEQIFISDAEGDRSYPTLSLDQYYV